MDFQGYLIDLKIELPDNVSNYPFNVPFLQNFDQLDFHPSVTYLIGENGMGKSTLIEAIAVYLGFNAEGGSKNFNFNTKETHSILHEHLRISKGYKRMKDGYFLRSESFYNVASEIDSMDAKLLQSYGGISLHKQSHGEAFWSLFMNRFGGNGLYILDEPESALSIRRQMAMLVHIHKLAKTSQFIIATHSPVLLAYPDAIIYELTEEGIKQVKYKETELYTISKSFLDNPEKMLAMLLE
jgi:predicted ATPase